MDPRVSLITLGVRDLAAATRFYQDGLGWPLSSASVEGEVAFFRTQGAIVALYPRRLMDTDAGLPESTGAPLGVTLAHNTATRDEVDRLVTEAKAAGARITREPAETPWGGYCGYFLDPEGYLWEIAWNPAFPFAEDGSLLLP